MTSAPDEDSAPDLSPPTGPDSDVPVRRSFSEYRAMVAVQGPPSLDARRIPRGARSYQGTRAGVVARVIAALIDVCLIAAIVLGLRAILLVWFVVQPGPSEAMLPTRNEFIGLGAVLLWGMWAACWARGVRTCGGLVIGVRVIGRSGGRAGAWLAMLRAALCLIFPIGIFWAAFSPANRSLQDVLLRTSVIIDWRLSLPTLLRRAPVRSSSLRSDATS